MTFVQTRCGQRVDLIDPRPETLLIYDIDHALHQLARFTGHLVERYTVANHSVAASYLVPNELAYGALMHDAHEAYVGDMAAPIKTLLGASWAELEARMQRAVRERFHVPLELPPAIKEVDFALLHAERRLYLGSEIEPWSTPRYPALERQAISVIHATRHIRFLDRYNSLRGQS